MISTRRVIKNTFLRQTNRLLLVATKKTRAIDLRPYVGSLRTPYDDAHKEQEEKITKALVKQHRLGLGISYYAMAAWHGLQNYPVEVLQPPTIGLLFKHCFAQNLASCDWKSGKKNQKDIVCIPDPTHSIEIRTTSQWKSDVVHGPASVHNALRALLKSEAPRKVRDGYHLIVSYDLSSMVLQKIRFGWLQDIDFVVHSSSVGAAKCPATVARTRLCTLYDDKQRLVKRLN